MRSKPEACRILAGGASHRIIPRKHPRPGRGGATRREIDHIVYRLFGLKPEEIALIESRLPAKP